MASSPFVSCMGVSYELPNGNTIFENLNFNLNAKIYGLVGANGVGKTTLLKILLSELQPSEGKVVLQGSIASLPQLLKKPDLDPELPGLNPILYGLNLSPDHLERNSNQLSGGEIVRLHLAKLLLHPPSILLLDEPTNNLDLEGKEALYSLIKRWRGCLVVVSHDRTLLNHVEHILELSSLGLRIYGGNYDFYSEVLESENQTLSQKITTAKQREKKETEDLRESLERQTRKILQSKRNNEKGGMPKIIANGLARKSQATLGKLKDRQQDRLAQAKTQVQDLRSQQRNQSSITVDLPETRVPATKELLWVIDFNFQYSNLYGCLLSKPVSFSIVGPQRVHIKGRNGAGKTTLLKAIVNPEFEAHVRGQIHGKVQLKTHRIAFLDQNAEVLGDGTESLLERFTSFTPHLTESERRIRLGRFLFVQEQTQKTIGSLSGGERMRAALACILFSETPPELLILDEPTNNLDLDSIQQIENALSGFQGGLLVISHDEAFLNAISISTTLELIT